MEKQTLRQSLEYLLQNADKLETANTAVDYINWLATDLNHNLSQPMYVDEYLPVIRSEQGHGDVFATVVMRTQGRRPEALREALLCLYAQSDRDFEVVLIGHKLNEQQQALVQQVLAEQEPEFRRQIRYFRLDTGTRTTPLNFGYAHARGEYITILDDDDIVLENWIASFRRAAQKKNGAMLHVMAYGQDWQVIDTAYGNQALRACHAPDAKYCVPFEMLEQIYMNRCPMSSWAIPGRAFREMGILFDEALTTTEDWDYFMRVAFVCGVSDEENPQVVYRTWLNAESSATVHNQDEWAKNYELIQKKFEKTPIMLDIGTSRQSIRLVEQSHYARQIVSSRSWRAMQMAKDGIRRIQQHRVGRWLISGVWRVSLGAYRLLRKIR